MAFTVETGNGVIAANSYATLAGMRAYFADRPENATVVALADLVLTGLLVCATDYIDTRWGGLFKGDRQFDALASRSILTLTANPTAAETVTFGAETYTFVVTPVADNDVEIGVNEIDSLAKLAVKIAEIDKAVSIGALFTDPDIPALTLYATIDGTVSTEGLAAGSFDNATTTGSSNKRQPLEFPRKLLRDRQGDLVESVPDKLKNATYEYALTADTVTLAPNPTVDASGRPVVFEKLGPLETKFDGDASPTITKDFPTADRLLGAYVRNASGVIRN